MDQPTATLLAATLAAVVSLFCLLVNYRSGKAISQLTLYADENKEVRRRLRQLAELLTRAEVSSRRLVALSPQLSPSELMHEATDTLAIVAEVFRETRDDKKIDFPARVTVLTDRIRHKMTVMFLRLDISEEREQDQAKLNACFVEFATAVAECHHEIRKIIAPPTH